MGKNQNSSIKSLISLTIIFFTLFAIAFVEMEERRMNYVLLQKHREYRKALQQYRKSELAFAKMTKPQRLDKLAKNRLTMKTADYDQVIHLTNQKAL